MKLDATEAARYRAEERVERLRSAQPDVYQLALGCSLAAHIEPELVRALRIGLGPVLAHPVDMPPVPLSAATEGRLWRTRLIESVGPGGITLQSPEANALRRRLRDDPRRCRQLRAGAFALAGADEEGVSLAEAARAIVSAVHAGARPERRWEEALIWELTGGAQAVDARVLALLPLLDEATPARAAELAQWAIASLRRLPDIIWEHPSAWSLGVFAQRLAERAGQPPLALPVLASKRMPSSLLTPALPMNAPAASRREWVDLLPTRTVRLGVARGSARPDTLVVREPPQHGDETIDVPDTRPRLVELRRRDRPTDRRLLGIEARTSVEEPIWPGEVDVVALDGSVLAVGAMPTVQGRERREQSHRHRFPAGDVVGRLGERDRLTRWLHTDDPQRTLSIEGEPGSGRSVLAGWLLDRAEERGLRAFAWRFDEKPQSIDCLVALAGFLDVSGYWAVPDGIRALRSPIVVALDGLTAEMAAAPPLRETIAALRASPQVRLLVTGERGLVGAAPLSGAEALPLGPLDATAARLMLPQVSGALAERLAAAVDGQPLALAVLGGLLSTTSDPEHEAEAALSTLQSATSARERLATLLSNLLDRGGARALGTLGAAALHGEVRRVLDQEYQPLEAREDVPLAPLANLADEDKNHRLRELILGQIGHPNDVEVLDDRVLDLLGELGAWGEQPDEGLDWRFWRAAANLLSSALKHPTLPAAQRERILSTLRAHGVSDDWDLQQLASLAVSKSGLIEGDAPDPGALELAQELWTSGFPAPADAGGEDRRAHPQVTWTLVKDGKTAPILGEYLRDFDRLEPWARDRLLLSIVELPASEARRLGRLDREHPAVRYLQEQRSRFLGLLLLWRHVAEPSQRPLDPNTVFDLPEPYAATDAWQALLGLEPQGWIASDPSRARVAVADVGLRAAAIRAGVRAYLDTADATADDLSVLFDVASLAIDRAPTANLAGGRYTVFEHLAAVALTEAGADAASVAEVLAQCHEEGVRWGVAKRLGTRSKPWVKEAGLRNLRDLLSGNAAQYWRVLRTYAADDHQWVVRDTIKGAAEVWRALTEMSSGPPAQVEVDGVAALAEIAARWIDAHRIHNTDYRAEVQVEIDALAGICRPFGEVWWRLRRGD
ncbi:MAG: hypothetical protein R3F65_21345 [bacterium]